MKCEWLKVGNMTAVVCGPRRPAATGTCATCGKAAGFQCDEPKGEGTCDAWCCARHAYKVGPNRHRCQSCDDHAYQRSRKA